MDFLKPNIREKLMNEHPEFRKLIEEHKAADDRLSYLASKFQLSTKEAIEETELKKIKLRAKERLYNIVENISKESK